MKYLKIILILLSAPLISSKLLAQTVCTGQNEKEKEYQKYCTTNTCFKENGVGSGVCEPANSKKLTEISTQETAGIACQGKNVATWSDCSGTYAATDGAKYVGEFKNGKFEGKGTYTFPNGEKYIGEFKGGKYDGEGVIFRNDGVVRIGDWIENKIDGRFIEYGTDKSIRRSGIVKDGKLVESRYIDPNSFASAQAIKNAEGKRIQDSKEAEEKRIQEAKEAEEKLLQEAKAAEERKVWLTTPAGKKFAAEEEIKAKKKEAERLKLKLALAKVNDPFVGNAGDADFICPADKSSADWNNCYAMATTAEGQTIIGNIRSGKLNGYGSITEKDGSRSFGIWVNGLKNAGFVDVEKNGKSYQVSSWKMGEKLSSGSGGRIPECAINNEKEMLIGVTCVDASSIRNIIIGQNSYKYYDAETRSGKYKWAVDCERKLFAIANFGNVARPYFNDSPDRVAELIYVCDPKNNKLSTTTVDAVLNSPEAKKNTEEVALFLKNKADMQRKQWSEYVCDGKYTQTMNRNTILQNNISAQAGFAYQKTNDKVVLQLPIGNRNIWTASNSAPENIPNFSVSVTSKDAKYVMGMYHQQGGGMKFNAQYDIKNSTLNIIWSIGGLDHVYTGKCRAGEFINF